MIALTPPKQSALPEHHDYRDDGCDLFPTCLSCPLAECRYVVNPSSQARQQLAEKARELAADGVKIDDIARAIGRGRRTVFRMVAHG